MGVGHKKSIDLDWIKSSQQEPKLDPDLNRTIHFPLVAAKPSEWARLRRMLTPRKPTRSDLGGCLVAVVFIVVGVVIGRCAN